MKNGKAEAQTEEEAKNFAQTDAFVEAFEKAMDDDFNTADALAAVFELVKFINTSAGVRTVPESTSRTCWIGCGL